MTTPVTYDLGTEDMRRNFASLYAYGVPIPQALVNAGYGNNSTLLGLKVLNDPVTQAGIDEVRRYIASQIAVTKEQILTDLERDREFAVLKGNAAAAVSATMAKAKIMGFLDPDTAKTPKKIVIEWGEPLPPGDARGSPQGVAE